MIQKKRMIWAVLAGLMMVSLGACQKEDNQDQYENKVEMKEFQTSASIKESVLVDEQEIKITAMNLSYTTYSVELDIMIENLSDQDLTFISNSIGYSCNAVNGYMVMNGYLNEKVEAGKKANETIVFSMDELMMLGIYEISDIQVGFDVTDDQYHHFYTGPRQVKTTAYDKDVNKKDTYAEAIKNGTLEKVLDCHVDYYTEKEFYKEADLSIISAALITTISKEKAILLEVVNTSSQMVYGSVSNTQINELTAYGGKWSNDLINSSSRRVIQLPLSSMLNDQYWEMMGLDNIQEFCFTFQLFDTEFHEISKPQDIILTFSDKKAVLNDTGKEVYHENDIRIISKGLLEDELSDDIHLILLIENRNDEGLSFDVKYDSLSVNDYMVDEISYSSIIPSKKYGILDIEIQDSSLMKNNIMGLEDFQQVKVTLEIKNKNYKTLDEPVIIVDCTNE